MLKIKKDHSEKTYEYILTLDGEEILTSDGWESEEEIKEFFSRVKKVLEE